jgi:hypothetical protein
MMDNMMGNAQNPAAQAPEDRDWREMRREWREGRREARRRFPFRGLFAGLTLVLLGVLFLLNQEGTITGDTWWQVLLIGLGVISIIDGMAHYHYPGYRWGSYGKFVCGGVLILIGVLFLVGFSQWWPLALIMAGVALLLRFFWRR